jgi:major membrane immunogen (membrane-anchored lipoprotein)
METYARQYASTKNLSAVDAISGATIAYNQFLEAVAVALEEAAKRRSAR